MAVKIFQSLLTRHKLGTVSLGQVISAVLRLRQSVTRYVGKCSAGAGT
jgi:hypothetical protein